jgi:rRNA-processing protein FCF1
MRKAVKSNSWLYDENAKLRKDIDEQLTELQKLADAHRKEMENYKLAIANHARLASRYENIINFKDEEIRTLKEAKGQPIVCTKCGELIV